ncbi:MAG TPA: hypothetical protein VKR56_11635 [Candidatus Cybelea sp.]|nr:hypothetical protein [Candidatus Cybelea sp.]
MDTAAAPPALVQVAQRYLETSRGVVGFTLHRVLDVHAGFQSRHEDLVMVGVYDDGAIVKVRIVSYTIDGRPASASDDAAMEHAYEEPKAGDAFQPPFDARYAKAYSYRQETPQTIAFTSNLRDGAHGNGTFAYDADRNVVWYEYRPNVLPPHAASATILDRRAEVLPRYWAVTQETQEYRGSYGPFPGTGTEQVDFSDFSRFPDLQSALRSI